MRSGWSKAPIEIETPRTYKESVDLFRIGRAEVDANPDGIDREREIRAHVGVTSPGEEVDPGPIALENAIGKSPFEQNLLDPHTDIREQRSRSGSAD